MSHPVGGSGGGSGHDNDPAFSDKTRIVTRSDEENDADAAPGQGGVGPDGTAKIPASGGAGKVVGVAGSGQGVRLPGFGAGAQSPAGGGSAGGGAPGGGNASPPGGAVKRPSAGQVTQLVLHGSAENKAEQDDPVVGWLVVMKGPGVASSGRFFTARTRSVARRINGSVSILVTVVFHVKTTLTLPTMKCNGSSLCATTARLIWYAATARR